MYSNRSRKVAIRRQRRFLQTSLGMITTPQGNMSALPQTEKRTKPINSLDQNASFQPDLKDFERELSKMLGLTEIPEPAGATSGAYVDEPDSKSCKIGWWHYINLYFVETAEDLLSVLWAASMNSIPGLFLAMAVEWGWRIPRYCPSDLSSRVTANLKIWSSIIGDHIGQHFRRR